MPSDFILRGAELDPAPDDDFALLYGDEVGYTVRHVVATTEVARGAPATVELTGEDDDVIEVEDVDGVVRFDRAASLVTRARQTGRGADLTGLVEQVTRGDDGSRVAVVRRTAVSLPHDIVEAVRTVDTIVGADAAARGTLRSPFGMILGRLPEAVLDPAARAAMKKVVDWIDSPVADDAPAEVRRKRPKAPGVYRLDEQLLLEPANRLDAAHRGAGSEPYLVLLHGTFSHTEATFGSLRGTPEWDRLAGRYHGRVLAIEHPTLGLTPAENALAAARSLPEGARLHLVGHSRGGLVGEMLSYAARHTPALGAYRGVPQHPDQLAAPELHRVLTARGITVERFVRVACPARGTTLASRRLDRYASVLFNVLKLIPGMRESGVAALVKKFLLTLLEQRTDPRIVPGIEAQMPESPFMLMLASAPPLDDGLGSIAGDVEGAGLARKLMVFGADRFYRADHDFVVNTDSMTGGVARVAARRAFFQGPDVSHGGYFSNLDSRAALDAWLTATGPDGVPGFAAPTPLPPRSRSAAQRAAGVTGTLITGRVVLVPDVFGSILVTGGDTAWPNVPRLVEAGVDEVLDVTARAGATGVVEAYDPLREALAERYAVIEAPYDSRESLTAAGAALAETLDEALAAGSAPVHLVTHGAGALVVLAARTSRPQLWTRLRERGGRAVLLSPPLAGSWLAAAQLAGRDELSTALALLDPVGEPAHVGELLAHWPALVELLPEDGAAVTWRRGILPQSWEGMTAIYGNADRTVCGVAADGTFCTTSAGDGHVTYEAARASTLLGCYALVPHVDLPADPDVAVAVLDLLAGRTPGRLFAAPLASSPTIAPLPDPRGELLVPTAGELVRMAWGSGRPGPFAAAEQRPTLRVSVVHGDLRSTGTPVLIGTRDGTPLDGAQEALDRHLGGALSRRGALGQYPGPVGTCAVFGGAESSAIVLGLGDAGDITPGRLAIAVTQGVLRLAATFLDAGVEEGGVRRVTISSVLIGTSGVAPLPIQASVTALVTGVRRADRKLRELGQPLVVEALQIVELYEERAIQAIRAAARLPQDLRGDGGSEIAVNPRVVDGCDGRPGLPRLDYNDGAWRTVRVVAAPSQPSQPSQPALVKDGATEPPAHRLVELSFTSVGRAARAEQRVSTGQRALIDKLVAETINSPFADRQLWNTLYELLVPNAMKGQGGESEHLMYVVDEHAAALPLEMLATRAYSEDVTPLAVEVGVVRRLETRTFREQMRTATGHRALVIADPPDTGLPPLDGAVHEANAVADVLASLGWEVTRRIRGGADPVNVVTILNALFAHEYRIVHVAGHGNVSTDPTRSGVAIGPDIYLTALEIEKMATTPDLVFLNCCHLAKLGEPLPHRPDQLAASISRQLIDNGVRAVVAAGWAVDDAAAATFATHFYHQLLDGADLGTAARLARKRVYLDYGGAPQRINTWGAYQVYGPPAFRLAEAGARSSAGTDPVARRELADALAALRRQANDAAPVAVAPIRTELAQLRTAVPAQWLGAAEQATIGDIQAALGDYRDAVDTYQRALAEWGAGASLHTLEQLVNIQAKWAAELTLAAELAPDAQGPQTDGSAAQLFEDAEQRARALLALGETPERWSLLGSIGQRRAQCAPPQHMAEALAAAVDAYAKADKLYRERTGQVDFYPALNRVALEWLVTQHTAAPFDAEDALRVVQECRQRVADRPCPDFWCRVTPADADLVVALVQGSLPAVADAVAGKYTVEFAAGSSRRERMAVVEHLDILARALPARSELAATRAGLLELRTRLGMWAPRP